MISFVDILLYIILPLGVAGYLFLKKKFSHFEENGVLHLKPSWIFGNMDGVGSKHHMADFFLKLYQEFHDKDVIAGFYSFFSPSIIINDLELAKQILIKDFNNFADRGLYSNEKADILTANLSAVDGEHWKFLRNKMSPAFTSGKIKMMYNTIGDKGDKMIAAIASASKSGSVDMRNLTVRFTIDITSACAFGMESNTLNHEHPEFVSMFQKLFGEERAFVYFFFLMTFPNVAKLLNLRQFEKKVGDFIIDIITNSINHREENKIERHDFLNMLMQLKNKGKIDGDSSSNTTKFTMNEVIAQAFVFFAGGVDTTSTAVSFAITELSYNQEIQDKLRKELRDHTKEGITYEHLTELTYLNQVVNEALRKHTPGFINMRKARADFNVPNSKHVIKKGTNIIIPVIGFHHDPKYWKNPNKFDPDHFLPEEVAKRPAMAYIPFGDGPRNCVAMRFAQVITKFAVATIIKSFKVTLDTNKVSLPIKLDPKVPTMAPVGGFWLNFEKVN